MTDMFEKIQPAIDDNPSDTQTVETLDTAAQADDPPTPLYGPFSDAEIVIEEDTVAITVPLKHGVTTVRAHKAMVAAWATDNVAGELLDEAKNLRS